MKRHFLSILFSLLLCVESGLAQNNSWIITIATGDTLSGCSLVSLDGDSLRIVWSGYPVSLPVESLRELQYHRTSEFWKGAFYGSATGALVGTFAGSVGSASSSAVNGAIGVVAGFLAGGLVAEYISRDDRYDLLTYDGEQKKNAIRTLLRRPDFHERDERAK